MTKITSQTENTANLAALGFFPKPIAGAKYCSEKFFVNASGDTMIAECSIVGRISQKARGLPWTWSFRPLPR